MSHSPCSVVVSSSDPRGTFLDVLEDGQDAEIVGHRLHAPEKPGSAVEQEQLPIQQASCCVGAEGAVSGEKKANTGVAGVGRSSSLGEERLEASLPIEEENSSIRLSSIADDKNDAIPRTTVLLQTKNKETTTTSAPQTQNRDLARIRRRRRIRPAPRSWEDVRRDILLMNDDGLSLRPEEAEWWRLRSVVFEAGVTETSVLLSLLSLSSSRRQQQYCDTAEQHHYDYDPEALHVLATHLAHPVPPDRCKRACLRYLLRLEDDERMCDIALRFCTEQQSHTEATDDSEETTDAWFLQIRSLEEEQLSFLFQLRAVCRFFQDQRRQRDARVLQTAATAARGLSLAAQGVRSGLLWTAGAVSAGLEATGECVVRHSAPHNAACWDNDPKAAIRAVTYSGAARRATAHTRLAAATTVQHLRDAATRQIRDWSLATNNNDPHPHSWPRHPDQRVALQAAGHLALATLGAAALVGEGVVEGTSTVTQSATRAVAAVVEHRGGATAGRVVQDVGETMDNVWKTAAHVTLLSSSGRAVAVAKVVAKNTGKVHVEEQQEFLLMRNRCSSNDSDDTHHHRPNEQTLGCDNVVGGEVAIAKQDTVFY